MRVVWSDASPASVTELYRALLDALDGGPTVLPLDPRNPTAPGIRDAMRPETPVEPDTAVLIPTSGSTGHPKGTLLSAQALLASAQATHDRLGGPGRWLLATPPVYIGGLQVLVRSQLAGTDPVVLDTSSGFFPEAFESAARTLRASPGPHYTALVPTQLARLLDAGGAGADVFDAIVLGGAALPDGLRRAAEHAGLSVVPAYGMSETASGCVYDGVPLDAADIRLGPDDRIEVSGAVLAHGYRLDRAQTAECFVDGWFRTSDVGRLTTDNRLEVLGRLDDMINTGGVKVAARQVEDVLTRLAGIRAASVVGLPDPEWGQVVAAVVVPEATARIFPAALRETVKAELGAAAAPKVVRTSDELPLLGPGKVDRGAVRRLLHDHVDHPGSGAVE